MSDDWCDAVSHWMGQPGNRRKRVCCYRPHSETSKHSWQRPPFAGIVVMGPEDDPERVDVVEVELPFEE